MGTESQKNAERAPRDRWASVANWSRIQLAPKARFLRLVFSLFVFYVAARSHVVNVRGAPRVQFFSEAIANRRIECPACGHDLRGRADRRLAAYRPSLRTG
jgi:hypothetical protein